MIKRIDKIVFVLGRINSNNEVTLIGTCFLLNKPGLLATTFHMTGYSDNDLCIIVDDESDINKYQKPIANTQPDIVKVKIHKVDPVRDISILKVDTKSYSRIVIKGTDILGVSNKVNIFGYPHCQDIRKVLTYQNCEVGAKILLETSGILSKYIVLNNQCRPGQSGSPVFSSNYQLVGMIIGSHSSPDRIIIQTIDPSAINQTTYAISSEYIQKMISNE